MKRDLYKTTLKFGRRRPYLLFGALFSALALLIFPNSANIVDFFERMFGFAFPVWSGLMLAAIMIWILPMLIGVISDFFLTFSAIY